MRRAVEADVIPQLLFDHARQSLDVTASICIEPPNGAEIRRFARVLLGWDDDVDVSTYLAEARARGLAIDRIYLDLFQPTAQYIGELWLQDHCSFVDVTLAVGTLQRLLRTFGAEFLKNARPASGSRIAILAPLPGEQHTFGLSMVAEFFRRGGWSVSTASFANADALGSRVHSTWFDMVGFSASREDRLDELASLIGLVRRESLNDTVGVMVGGPVFLDRPELVERVGADALGVNAAQALARAEAFVSPAPRP